MLVNMFFFFTYLESRFWTFLVKVESNFRHWKGALHWYKDRRKRDQTQDRTFSDG